jgi:hypothetical protein
MNFPVSIIFNLLIVQLIFSNVKAQNSCTYLTNVDYNLNDLQITTSQSFNECCALCYNNGQCLSISWSALGTCILKSARGANQITKTNCKNYYKANK